jgi:signal transduction histidine kinase
MSENDTPRLRIDARVVRQLGAELITDPEQALLELIKNSYDADADRCRVVIDTTAQSAFRAGKRVTGDQTSFSQPVEHFRGKITVEDDGPGTTIADILDRWLVISASEKRPDIGKTKKTTTKGRTPLGDKGIGRLGTMRLGDCVQFISRPKGNDKPAKGVEFCWSEFEKVHTLEQVPVQEVSDTPSKGFSTRVQIEGLYEPEHWRSNDQSDLQARISKLISPFTEKQPLRVGIKIDSRDVELQRLVSDLELYATARHTFSLARRSNGDHFLTLTSDIAGELFGKNWSAQRGDEFYKFLTKKNPRTGLTLTTAAQKPKARWIYRISRNLNCSEFADFDPNAYPGDFSGRIYSISFSALPADVDSNTDSDDQDNAGSGITPPSGSIASLFKKLAGVNIYRDGFGVRIDQDWLEMSAGVTSGKSWYGLRRTNTIGHLDISSLYNAALIEKSDREGFVDTPAWRQFLLIAKKLRDEINTIYEELRRGFNDSYKAQQPGRAAKQSPDTAIKTLNSEARYAQSMRTALASQEKVLARAAELADQIKGAAARSAQNFKAEATRALKTVHDLIARDTEANTAEAVALLREELQTLRSQVRTAYDFIAAGMAAETLAHEVHPLLDRASELVQTAERATRRSGLEKATTDLQSARSYIRLVGKQLSALNPMLKIYRETKDTIRLADFLADYQEYVGRRLSDEQIKLNVDVKRAFSVHFPRGRLMQVIDNLVRNSEYWLHTPLARKAVPKPQITIQVAKPTISVWDNGIGVKPEIEDRIFDMFVSDKPRETGRGLGLYITREILIRYGCEITLADDRNTHDRRYRFDIDLSSIAQ